MTTINILVHSSHADFFEKVLCIIYLSIYFTLINIFCTFPLYIYNKFVFKIWNSILLHEYKIHLFITRVLKFQFSTIKSNIIMNMFVHMYLLKSVIFSHKYTFLVEELPNWRVWKLTCFDTYQSTLQKGCGNSHRVTYKGIAISYLC